MLAGDAHGPAAIRHFAQRVVRVGVVSDGFHQGLGFDVFHASSMPEKRGCVNYIITFICGQIELIVARLGQLCRQHPFQNAGGGGTGRFDVDAHEGAFAEVDHGVSGAE